MKKIFLAAAICALCSSAIGQVSDDYPQWLQALEQQNKGLIDSVAYYNGHPSAPDYRTYMIYYNQPLNHANPGGEHFHMRALITVNTKNDPVTAVNHVYCSGYALDPTYLNGAPDSVFASTVKECTTEIAHRYHANYIQIEHRYFQYSAPPQCWENLDPLTAEEAAEDFHNLFEGLKKVLHGKWVMSGVSKGGITTLLQHTFYPGDMDIFMPYSAPFFDTDRDTLMQKYWYTHGWTPELRDDFMKIRKAAMAGGPGQNNSTNTIWPIFSKMNSQRNTQEHADTLLCAYISSAAFFGFNEHAYEDTASIRKQLIKNDSIIRSYNWPHYNDTVIAYMCSTGKLTLDSIGKWIDTLRRYPDAKYIPGRHMRLHSVRPFGITEKEWWGETDTAHTGNAKAYEYQAKNELGYYDFRYEDITMTPEEGAAYNQYWKAKVGSMIELGNPYYVSRPFSRSLYDRVMSATRNATKPIILLYGEDDTWTGAAVRDEFINGTNVRKFILPAQNHSVHFTSGTDYGQCNAIRAVLDGVLGAPQGLEGVENQKPLSRSRKLVKNGQIYILRGGKTYTVTGMEVNLE